MRETCTGRPAHHRKAHALAPCQLLETETHERNHNYVLHVEVEITVDELLELLGVPKEVMSISLTARSPSPTHVYLHREDTKGACFGYELPICGTFPKER